MIYWLYEYLLKRQITELPGHVCFMISGQDMADAPGNLVRITSWCSEISEYVEKSQPSGRPRIHGLTFHISTPDPGAMKQYLPEIRKIGTIARLILHIGDKEEIAGSGMDVVVAIGNSGREEITACIRRMAEDHIPPADVDEKMLESYLTFKYTPDVVDQERRGSPHGFPYLAVGLFRALLLGCELEISAESGFPAGTAGLPVTDPQVWEVSVFLGNRVFSGRSFHSPTKNFTSP